MSLEGLQCAGFSYHEGGLIRDERLHNVDKKSFNVIFFGWLDLAAIVVDVYTAY